MDDILDEVVSSEDLQVRTRSYYEKSPNNDSRFHYLCRSSRKFFMSNCTVDEFYPKRSSNTLGALYAVNMPQTLKRYVQFSLSLLLSFSQPSLCSIGIVSSNIYFLCSVPLLLEIIIFTVNIVQYLIRRVNKNKL